MANAYELMDYAKRSGAKVQQQEDWERHQNELRAAEAKRSKGGFWSGLANMGIMKLLPILLPGVGAGTSLLKTIFTGLGRGALGFGLGELVRGVTGADTRAPEFKQTSTGPYGRMGARGQRKQAKSIRESISEQLAAGQRGRGFMSLASSALADKKAWEDWAKGLGKGKEGAEGIKSIMEGLDPDLKASKVVPEMGAFKGQTEQDVLNQLMGGGGGFSPDETSWSRADNFPLPSVSGQGEQEALSQLMGGGPLFPEGPSFERYIPPPPQVSGQAEQEALNKLMRGGGGFSPEETIFQRYTSPTYLPGQAEQKALSQLRPQGRNKMTLLQQLLQGGR